MASIIIVVSGGVVCNVFYDSDDFEAEIPKVIVVDYDCDSFDPVITSEHIPELLPKGCDVEKDIAKWRKKNKIKQK